MKYLFIILIVVLIGGNRLYSQTSDFKDKFSDADYYFLFDEYGKALKLYLELLKTDNSNSNINYLVGLCYIQSIKDKDKTKAIPYLEVASKNIDPNYKEGKYKETKAPVYSLFYLAFAYRLDKEFDKAIATYQTYLSQLNPKDKKERSNTMKEIDACEYAKKLIQVPINLESVKIDQFADTMKGNEIAMLNQGNKSDSAKKSEAIDKAFIKATSSESCPIVSNDGSFMVFSMGQNNQFPQEVNTLNFDFQYYKTDDIYYTTRAADGQWNKPVNIISQLKPKYQVVPVCLSPDGKTLLLVEDDNDNGNIYESKLENGKWSPIEKVKGDINTHKWETHASLSVDGKIMYFTSARSGGFGGLDIYKSMLKDNGEWGKAENLGATINTSDDEETPTILPDGKTLFFSSKGHKGIGGFDIFSSTLGSDGKWTNPLNAGYSINTVNNDFVYINKVNNQLTYTPLTRTDIREDYSGKEDKNNSYVLAINNEKPTKPSFDIKGTVVFKIGDSKMPEKYNIFAIDSARKDTIKNIKVNNETGEYTFNSTSGTYYISYQAEGYKEYAQRISLPEIYTPSTLTINVEMIPSTDKSDAVAQTDIIYDYEKNVPNLSKKRNINLAAFKNRDSLRLVAENNFKKRELLADVNKNIVGIDTTKKNETQLIAENKNLTSDKNNSKTEKQDNHAHSKTDTNNKGKQNDNKAANKQKDKQSLIAENNKQNNKNEKSDINKNNKDNTNKEGKQNGNKAETNKQNNQRLTDGNKQKQKDKLENKNISDTKQTKNENVSTAPEGSTVISNIFYDFDCLKPKAFRENLDKLANYLVNNKNCKIQIDGHSDAQGDDFYKQVVSEKRADFIKKYLADKGALKNNIIAKGHSSDVLIAKELLPKTRQYNRRAEFSIIENCDKLFIQPIVVPDFAKLNSKFRANNSYGSSEMNGSIKVHDILYNIDYFDPKETTNLNLLATYLKNNPTCEIEIVGHSDSQGEAVYKQFISEQRAANIKNMLVKRGVQAKNITVRGESDSKPISSNKSEMSQQYNRRVEFHILKNGTKDITISPIRVPEQFKIQ